MNKLSAILALFFLFIVPEAQAYVGPGAGLSLLGALWALLAAVATAVVFVVAWPIRRMRRRKREAQALKQEGKAQENSSQDARSPTHDDSRADRQPAVKPDGQADRLQQP